MGRELLKWVAIITMTIDHIGAVLYPEQIVFRIIGRLSFPIFGYLLVLGVESTRNPRNYFLRLIIFAFISQIPYYLAFGFEPIEDLNIFFDLSFGLIFLVNPVLFAIPFFISYLLFFTLNINFGLMAWILIACMRLLKNDTRIGIISLLGYGALSSFVSKHSVVSLFSLFSIPLIILYKRGYFSSKMNVEKKIMYPSWRKYFFYVYYPLHLTLLYLVKMY